MVDDDHSSPTSFDIKLGHFLKSQHSVSSNRTKYVRGLFYTTKHVSRSWNNVVNAQGGIRGHLREYFHVR